MQHNNLYLIQPPNPPDYGFASVGKRVGSSRWLQNGEKFTIVQLQNWSDTKLIEKVLSWWKIRVHLPPQEMNQILRTWLQRISVLVCKYIHSHTFLHVEF